MTSNAEKALSYAMSLAHATAGNGIRRTTEQIIEEARTYKSFLDEGELMSVFALESPTYLSDEQLSPLIGIYATREAAESYRDNATPPVTDGVITEWGVSDQIVGPDGKYLETGENEHD
jgi:hypothetical protein